MTSVRFDGVGLWRMAEGQEKKNLLAETAQEAWGDGKVALR